MIGLGLVFGAMDLSLELEYYGDEGLTECHFGGH